MLLEHTLVTPFASSGSITPWANPTMIVHVAGAQNLEGSIDVLLGLPVANIHALQCDNYEQAEQVDLTFKFSTGGGGQTPLFTILGSPGGETGASIVGDVAGI